MAASEPAGDSGPARDGTMSALVLSVPPLLVASLLSRDAPAFGLRWWACVALVAAGAVTTALAVRQVRRRPGRGPLYWLAVPVLVLLLTLNRLAAAI